MNDFTTKQVDEYIQGQEAISAWHVMPGLERVALLPQISLPLWWRCFSYWPLLALNNPALDLFFLEDGFIDLLLLEIETKVIKSCQVSIAGALLDPEFSRWYLSQYGRPAPAHITSLVKDLKDNSTEHVYKCSLVAVLRKTAALWLGGREGQ